MESSASDSVEVCSKWFNKSRAIQAGGAEPFKHGERSGLTRNLKLSSLKNSRNLASQLKDKNFLGTRISLNILLFKRKGSASRFLPTRRTCSLQRVKGHFLKIDVPQCRAEECRGSLRSLKYALLHNDNRNAFIPIHGRRKVGAWPPPGLLNYQQKKVFF